MRVTYRQAHSQGTFSTSKNKRSICRDSSNRIFIGYTNYTGTDQVYIAFSSDTGYNWTVEKVPGQDASENNRAICVAIDSNDDLIVVWQGRKSGSGEYQILYNKRSSAGVWSSSTIVADPAANRRLQWPSVAIDSNDTAHICWSETIINGTQYDDIRYNTVSVSEVLGSELDVTTLGNKRQVESQISVCRNDIAHIVWRGTGWGSNPTEYNIQYNTVTSGVLGSQVGISDRAATCEQPEAAVDSSGYVHIAYFEDYEAGAKGVYYTNNTSGSFASPSRLTEESIYGMSISLDSADNIYIFAGRNSYLDILENTGSGWRTAYTEEMTYTQTDVYSMWSWFPRSGGVSPCIISKYWIIYTLWPKSDYNGYLTFLGGWYGNPIIDQLIYQHAERMRTF